MKRLFIGIFVTDSINKKDYSKIKKDFGGVLSGKWSSFQNLHITLKFLGNVEEEKVDMIKETLSDILDREFQVNLIFKGLSVFPNMNNPKVFFIDVIDENKILEKLRNLIEEKLSQIGFKKENKHFHPHITLKRPKSVDIDDFLNKLNSYKEKIFGTTSKVKVQLIESKLTPKGAIYKAI